MSIQPKPEFDAHSATSYELWEAQSGNLMASYDSEGEALAAVLERARRHGDESIGSIVLVQVNDAAEDAEMMELAHGAELLARAEAATLRGQTSPVRVPRSA